MYLLVVSPSVAVAAAPRARSARLAQESRTTFTAEVAAPAGACTCPTAVAPFTSRSSEFAADTWTITVLLTNPSVGGSKYSPAHQAKDLEIHSFRALATRWIWMKSVGAVCGATRCATLARAADALLYPRGRRDRRHVLRATGQPLCRACPGANPHDLSNRGDEGL